MKKYSIFFVLKYQQSIVFSFKTLYIKNGLSKFELRFLMAQSDSKTQFLLSPPVAPFKLYKSSLKFLRFLLGFDLKKPIRADTFGSAAGGGAALTLRGREAAELTALKFGSNFFVNLELNKKSRMTRDFLFALLPDAEDDSYLKDRWVSALLAHGPTKLGPPIKSFCKRIVHGKDRTAKHYQYNIGLIIIQTKMQKLKRKMQNNNSKYKNNDRLLF